MRAVVGEMNAGIVTLIDASDASLAAIIFVLINVVAWSLHLLLSIYVLAASIRIFRGDPSRPSGALFRFSDAIFRRFFEKS